MTLNPLNPPPAEDRRRAWHRIPWGWLSALAGDLHLGVDVADGDGALCGVARGAGTPSRAQRRLAAVASQAAFKAATQRVMDGLGPERLTLDNVELALVRVQPAAGVAAPGVFVVARDPQAPSIINGVDLEFFAAAVARAVDAHVQQSAEQDVDAFDRVSSLHRLLHDAVERGSELEVVTACAEAVFAWDGIEISGYVWNADGQLTRQVSAPGAPRGVETIALVSSDDHSVLAPLPPELAERFGFDAARTLLAIEVSGPTLDPWLLLFAEGFGKLNEARVNLYVDLLREALGRASAITETRTAWAVLQPLLGAGDAEAAATSALGELARALPAQGAALVVTASNGAVVLNAGDDDPQSSVRPFGRATRLVSTAKTTDGYTLNLSARRAPGEAFTRREQHILDRAAGVFATWLTRTLTQGILLRERRAERRDFDQVLDRAAVQALRDGMDVAVVVIPVPDGTSRSAVLRAWIVELRSRLRGSDLAGALSDREVGILLCGTTTDTVDAVIARLLKHLKSAERGGPAVTAVGVASRTARQGADGSLVTQARRSLSTRGVNEGGGRR